MGLKERIFLRKNEPNGTKMVALVSKRAHRGSLGIIVFNEKLSAAKLGPKRLTGTSKYSPGITRKN